MTSTSNMFGSLNDLEEVPDNNLRTDPNAAKKKRKRKKKKKPSATNQAENPTDNIQLKGEPGAANTHQSEGVQQINTETPAENSTLTNVDSEPPSSTEQPVESVTAAAAPLSLEERLTRGAKHEVLKDCIGALMGWNSMPDVAAEDVKLFFTSRAVVILLENFMFQNQPVLLNALQDFLFSALAKATSCVNKNQASLACRAFVHRIRKVMAHLDYLKESGGLQLSSMEDLGPVAGGMAESLRACMGYLEEFACKQRELESCELEGGNATAVCRRLNQIEGELQAIRQPPSDIRAMFQRRDLCHERVNVLKNALKAQGKKAGGNDGTEGLSQVMNAEATQLFVDAALNGLDLEGMNKHLMKSGEVDLDPKGTKEKAKALQAEIESLQKERDENMEPLEEEQQRLSNLKDDLSGQRAELLKQLEKVDAELEDLKGVQDSNSKEIVAAQKRYVNAVKRTPNYEDGLLELVQRLERRESLCQDVETLAVKMIEDSEKGYLIDVQEKVGSEKRDTEAIRASEAHLDPSEMINPEKIITSTKAYLPYELKCIKFVKSRVGSGRSRIKKLSTELQSYKMLNMNTMVKGAEVKLTTLKEALAEDERTLAFLTKSAEDTYANLRLLLDLHEETLPGAIRKEIPRMRFLCKEIGVGHDWEGAIAREDEVLLEPPAGQNKETAPPPKEEPSKKPLPSKTTAFSWGGAAKKLSESSDDMHRKVSKMSIIDIQREELEDRLTKENLSRLEMGKRPARSPLLDQLRIQKNANDSN